MSDNPTAIETDAPSEPTPPPVVNTPAPPPPPEPPKDDTDLRTAVEGLTSTVTGLVTTVQSLVDGRVADEVPVKKPWTHWGSR
jgi:hypothetical protein